jgi:hypothetical protein
MKRFSKIMVGQRTGNGAVLMNQPLPRPQRYTAVESAPLRDGPYPYFSVEGMLRLSATVTCQEPGVGDAAAAVVAMEGTTSLDPENGSWQQLAISGTLDGTSGEDRGEVLEYEGAMRFVRFVVTGAENNNLGADPDSVVLVEFFGM